ncbi:Retrovirus-related Pol polyprotein from transposon TNT 1-94 [Abeliophyllum distichum]|uniref:Retrovirus-related Pol polyprotein from transposon TNT 1-94 n=1 Tax=Abeliophyllum distichum TaxID=126358 RepID=A0ABD1PDS1_9LAMI
MEGQVVIPFHHLADFLHLDLDLTPLPELTPTGSDVIKEKRKMMQEDEFICKGHILNALFDCFYDLYTNITSAREIYNALKNKFRAEEEGTKKFLISKYFDFKFLDNIHLLGQVHELQVIINKIKSMKIEIILWNGFKSIFELRKNQGHEMEMNILMRGLPKPMP